MAVTNSISRVQYQGDGSTVDFDITFDVTLDDYGNAEDIRVYLSNVDTGTFEEITDDVTVSGIVVTVPSAYSTSERITIVREPEATQESDFTYGSSFPSSAFNRALDKLTFLIQSLIRSAEDSVRIKPGDDTLHDDGVTPTDMRLPSRGDRKSALLGFNAQGDPIASGGSASVAVSTYMATVLDDADAGAAQDTLKVDYDTNIITKAGLTPNGQDMSQMFAAMRKINIQDSHGLMDIVESLEYKAPKAFDETAALDASKDAAEVYNPVVCLSEIEGYLEISESNYPDLVQPLRERKAYLKHNKTGEKSDFSVVSWAIVSNVVTLTFSGTDEGDMLQILSDDNLAHGGYNHWQTITLPLAIGDIPAGDYELSDVDPMALTVSFPLTAPNNSGSVTAVASFYRHRVAGSTTTARLFPVDGYAIMSEGSDRVSGFRKLDQMQGHWHKTGIRSDAGGGSIYLGNVPYSAGTRTGESSTIITDPENDGTNGTPRTGAETRPRNLAAYMYLWGRSYVA